MAPHFDMSAIRDMGPPLTLINRFIYMNLIEPAIAIENGYVQKRPNLRMEDLDEKVIPLLLASSYSIFIPIQIP